MIIINLSNLAASFLSITALITIKVVYDHTRIASYWRWGSKSVGQLHMQLLVPDGRSVGLAGGHAQ
jgi:hypothetical protein